MANAWCVGSVHATIYVALVQKAQNDVHGARKEEKLVKRSYTIPRLL